VRTTPPERHLALSSEHSPVIEQPATPNARRGLASIPTRVFPVLENRDFRYLWSGQIMGASAMWMEQVARNWLTWEMTGSALQLGAVNFARAVPSILAGLFAGVMADRVSKRRLLLLAQTWSFFVYATMAWVVLSDNLHLWHLYASTMALALGMSVSQPVRAAFVPALVPAHQVIGALSLNATAMNGSRVLWPAIAGVLIATINPGYAYVVSVAFYVVLQWTTFKVHNADAPDPNAQLGSVGGSLAAGFKFVWNEKLLLALLLTRFGPITVASGFQILIPVYAVTVLGMGAGAYGALLSAEGLGAIIGGFTIASRRKVPRPGLIALIAGSALGILLMAVSFVSIFWVFWFLLVLIGISQITFQSSNNGAMFARTPPEMRGRMVGVRNQSRAFVPFSQLGAGAIAESVGVQPAFAIFGAASLVVLWAIHLWKPSLRNI